MKYLASVWCTTMAEVHPDPADVEELAHPDLVLEVRTAG
jgi:hypothetical protein